MRLYPSERTIAWAVLSGWMILSAARGAHASAVELLRSVEVRGATIRLSDLLPATASNSLRDLAAGVVLGTSPQPGSRRILQGEFIQQSIRQLSELPVDIKVPEQITVARGFRRISSEEILHAILAAVQKEGSGTADSLKAGDLELQAPVLITEDNPEVQVIGMDYDRARAKTRFLLRLKNEPGVLPFCVLVPLRIPLPARKSAQAPPRELTVGQNGSRSRDHLPALAEAGKPATMLVYGPGFRITTTVVPLQPGAQGQRIRVRSLATGQVLDGMVTGPGMLRAAFPEGDSLR